jgi:long-chain acyl-CoA synthetase
MALHVMDEANRCLQCKVPQCQKGCPINTNIPMAIRLLKENKLNEAGKMLFENNPLTTVCSLICNHENQCEGHCVLGRKGAPVHFSTIENYISSTYANQMTEGPKPSNGMRVAIIGSGPAGITIAIILARYGYQVTIFEGKDKIGGVLRYGIPEFRLPKTVLDDIEYRHLALKGIKIRPNTTIGGAIGIDDLFRDGYKSIFIGTGVWKPNSLHIKGETFGNVHFGINYLREITWSVFNEKANRFANMLIGRGIKKGDKVAIIMYNCLEWLPIYFGVLKTGAIAVPFNFRYDSDEIYYCAELAEVDVIVFGPQFIGRIEVNAERLSKGRLLIYVGDNCPSFAESYRELVADCSSKAPDVTITEDDYGAIYFSSGTTGFPKAILHKHRSLTQAAEMEQKHHGTGRYDTFLCIPPLYHTGAKFHWMGSLVAGSKAVLLKGTKPETILKAVSDEECTIVWLLVPWAQDILDALDRGDIKLSDYRLDQWRLMHIGAQPVPPSLIKRWKEYFPKHQYDTNYGLSESTGPGCVHLGVENINKVGAIGIPGYRWECKIVDEDGNTVKQGDVGELCVKGPGVMTCYYRNEEATKEVLKDGWLYTGDMAMQDEDGFYFLVDRKKDVIVSGGENIYPVQIEDFIRRFNKVKDVAVIGLPDHRLGEKTAAIIEVKDGVTCTKEEIEDFCMELPRYKRPKEIIFADIPRNATGKIEKPKLRKMYGADRLVEQENKG